MPASTTEPASSSGPKQNLARFLTSTVGLLSFDQPNAWQKEAVTSDREKWIMAAILGAGALYLFELKALYLIGVAALIYFIYRSRGR